MRFSAVAYVTALDSHFDVTFLDQSPLGRFAFPSQERRPNSVR
jgi:hypothetical protein